MIRSRRRSLAAVVALSALLAAGALAFARAANHIDTHGAVAYRFVIRSRDVGKRLGVSVVVPSGGTQGRPLVVFLHGRGGNDTVELGNPAMYDGLAAAAARAPVMAFPYGGDHSYWHNRRDGRWGDYVVDEVIPAVQARFHIDARRVAIGGVSMGGFGAFDLAGLHPHRFCAAAGHSPAIWQSSGQTAPGAFDDAADFHRHDVIAAARRGALRGIRLRIDAGRSDPFQAGDRAFVVALRAGRAPFSVRLSAPGGHDDAYWRRHWREYVAFYADALARC